jgi:hypothetical protein
LNGVADSRAWEPELPALAYQLSLRALGQQEASLNELRARTGTLIAAASVVTSFLGGTAIARTGIDVWSVLALVAFVGSIAFSTAVLLPKEDLRFSVFGSVLFEQEIQDDVFDIAETHRRLAYFLDGYHPTTIRRSIGCSTSTARRLQHCLPRSASGRYSSR